MKKMNKKGFTLMEMLIVIAIIAILIAIAIPTFTAALEKSRQKTDLANARALKSLVVAAYMADETADATLVAGINGVQNNATVGNGYKVYLNKDGQTYVTGTPGESCMKLTSKEFKGESNVYVYLEFNGKCVVIGGVPDLSANLPS